MFESVCGTVGVVHRSRGSWGRRVTVVRMVSFRRDFRYVGWGHDIFFSVRDWFCSGRFRLIYISGRVGS